MPVICGYAELRGEIHVDDSDELLERRVVCWKRLEKTDVSSDSATC
ncbi:hypothetical protein A2U01_0095301, partial [Trifolium medium]|nr:hypothetical protein [Trifolium medium]